MNNIAEEIKAKLTKTIIIGLPGVGKSTLSDELARIAKEKTGVEIEAVSSDIRFRNARTDRNNPVVQKFMQDHNIPESDFPLLIKTNEFIKKYGEPTFRDLESDIILDMLSKGEFDGQIPNLGGKAMLHPKTAAAFKAKGYKIIYLKTDLRIVAAHVTKDFEAMIDGATITRSNINGPILDDLKKEFPDIATESPMSFVSRRIADTCKSVRSNDLQKAFSIQAKKKADFQKKRHLERIKERNRKALEIITKLYIDRNPLYEQVADASIFITGRIKEDIALLCSVIGIENLSENVKDNRVYTNAIYSKNKGNAHANSKPRLKQSLKSGRV